MSYKTKYQLLAVLTVTLLCACTHRPPERDAGAGGGEVARVLAQPSPESAAAEARRVIDSVATAAPENLRGLIFGICKALRDRGDVQTAASVAAYPYGVDAAQNGEIALRLLTSTLLPGSQAPAIEGLAPAAGQPAWTILLFHESACRTCQGLVWEIRERYRELLTLGVRVVTVSTDTNEKAWTEYAAMLPWPDKLCDYRGFYNPNMVAWGVAATPTLFLIDGKGKVVDQYGTTDEIWKVIFDK